ncbi:MAG: hypothetical protein JXQ76_08660 [Campylobacterales bacterium]|nr:hypothetical protein [Campylobacterales bacterium]
MQVVKKIILTLVVVLLSVVVFAPKERLYFLVEEQLGLSDVIISNEELNSKLLGIDIKNGSISLKGVTIATIDEIDVSTLLLFNSVDITHVVLDASSKSMIPINEFNLTITHSLFAPKSFGLRLRYQEQELQGKLKFIEEGMVRIEVEDINGSEWLKPMMQEDENGWYYENAI